MVFGCFESIAGRLLFWASLCVHVLEPVPSPLWVSDLSLRHAVGEGFLLGLRPDLGGVWMF